MHKAKDRLITIIAMIAIALVVLPVLAFGLGSNKSVGTCWQVNPSVRSDTNVRQKDNVIIQNTFKVASTGEEAEGEKKFITGLYLYLGNVFDAPNGVIEFAVAQSGKIETLKTTASAFNEETYVVEVNKGDYLGWVKLPIKTPISQEYVKISTRESFEFFEVAFINKDDEVLVANCVGGMIYKNGKHQYREASVELDSIALITDEQKSITPIVGVNALSKAEVDLLGAVDNLVNGKSGYVSKSANAMGVSLTALGVGLFGSSPFGLSIVGFLFFVATLYLIFFFAKKIFASAIYALIATGLYLFAGMGLSLTASSSVLSISLFFVVASLYFAYDFHLKAHDAKEVRRNSNKLILSGFTFAFALSISLSSLFILPVLLIICLIPSIKGIIEARKTFFELSGLEKEYAREKYNSTLTKVITRTLVGFVVAPILLMVIGYGLGYFTYTDYYQKGLIGSILKNNAQLFAYRGQSFFLPWAIGLGKDVLPNAFGVNAYIVSNRALVAISFLSLLVLSFAYIRLRKASIVNVDLMVALNESKPAFIMVLCGFLTTWLLNAFYWGGAHYSNFAISLIFAVLSLTLLYKLAKVVLKKWLLRTLTISLCVIVVAFFLLETPFIFNFELSEKLQVIYSWLV